MEIVPLIVPLFYLFSRPELSAREDVEEFSTPQMNLSEMERRVSVATSRTSEMQQ